MEDVASADGAEEIKSRAEYGREGHVLHAGNLKLDRTSLESHIFNPGARLK